MRKAIAIIWYCVTLWSAGWAAEPTALREITVTAAPVEAAVVSKIDSAELRSSIANSVADLIAENSGVFIRQSGRAAIATISFRGTSASHTQTTWNGMKIASPMLGTTDFSLMPSYFIDEASLAHGSASISDVGGGIGGLVKLKSSTATLSDGFSANFLQGYGSWNTIDDFLALGYAKSRLRLALRASWASSDNDFSFINHDKKVNVYDDNHQIIESYYPKERNTSGSFKDLHTMLSGSYSTPGAGTFGMDVWVFDSNRELPVLTTDYSTLSFENRQRERGLRSVVSWRRHSAKWQLYAAIGFNHSYLKYLYRKQLSQSVTSTINATRCTSNSLFATFQAQYRLTATLNINGDIEIYRHFVTTTDQAPLAPTGYRACRTETSTSLSATWHPHQRTSLQAILRQETAGDNVPAPNPALFASYLAVPSINLTAKASCSLNHRFPSLNDLYTLPGGNPGLNAEKGFTYDAGISFAPLMAGSLPISFDLGWYDSHISDWIQWLPSPKGYWAPRNVKTVRAYGIESSISTSIALPKQWLLDLTAHYTLSKSINRTNSGGADPAYDKQLPYIPVNSFTATAKIGYAQWQIVYTIQAYSERYTMTSNEPSLSGRLKPYTVSNLSLQRDFQFKKIGLHTKIRITNLFNADYRADPTHPMPPTALEAFVGIKI